MRCGQSARLRIVGFGALAALLATAASTLSPAAPLDQQTCDQLKREVGELEGLGVRSNMSKGAAWGRANLNSAKLEEVKKLIEMDEAIAFRCPQPKPQPERVAAAAAATPGKVKAKVLPKAPPRVKSAAAPNAAAPGQEAAKPKAKVVPKPASASAVPADPSAAPPKPKPRPPAPKPPDAYAPPPKAPPQ